MPSPQLFDLIHILRCIFSEKIYFDEKKDATIIYTKPIETILLISNSLNLYKQKKTGQFRPVFCCCSPKINFVEPFY
jgi:uncharacterized protein with PIN domain